MRVIFAALALLPIAMLTGCGVTDCIDAAFPPPSERLPGSHTIEIDYKGQATITTTVTCERYYDAMCAERGNFWNTREIGTNDSPHLVRFITINDPNLGEVKIERPSCELFKGPAPKKFASMILIRGERYFYSGEVDRGHVFVKRDFALQKIDPAVAKTVTIPFTIRVDGKALEPPNLAQS
jgi:hypothetical protein